MNDRWLDRWDHVARPTPLDAVKDLLRRVVAPAVVLWLLIVGTGFLITGPLGGLPGELSVNRWFEERRTPLWDNITAVWSHVGNTEIVIGVCVVAVAVIWKLTGRWWVAVVPAIAISTQATVFVLATAVVGRSRPDVELLDPAPPTSSYPSGHVGASTALYLVLALQVQRVRSRPLRLALTAVFLLVPALVLVARLYRGMHHVSDVTVGVVNGACCAALAHAWLPRTRAGGDAAS